jgi:excisionase family DNA binding protein
MMAFSRAASYSSVMSLAQTPSPIKTPVHQRVTLPTVQAQQIRDAKQALTADPLMPLREAFPMLGNPSYTLARRWIREGLLRAWRVGRFGHFKVRLSEVQRFMRENEVSHE